jgi:hypothetical protein
MTLPEMAFEEEYWSPVAVLAWIVTRSRRFAAELNRLPFAAAEGRLWQLQRENHSLYAGGLSCGLAALRQEAERGSLSGSPWQFLYASDGALRNVDVQEFASMAISFRAEEVRQIWPEWPAARAWRMANAHPCRPPRGSSKIWIRSLFVGENIPFADVTSVLAFGQAKMAVGLSDLEERTEELRAGLAITRAAAEGLVKFTGVPCERLANPPHLLRRTGLRIPIGPEVLCDLGPVPYGGRDWLGPRRFAEDYAEIGHAPQSVSFYEVTVERSSLVRWFLALSTKAPRLCEAEVRNFIFSEKTKNSSIGIGAIEQMVKSKDPLFPREMVRQFAREIGIEGKRGRPRKNSAG